MRRSILNIICLSALSVVLVQQQCSSSNIDAFIQHFEAGQNFFNQGQYSSAIVEFRKSLRINYMDNSARIGLINAYLARATFYANQEKNYEKAANDFRSAIFYLKMYPTKEQIVENASAMVGAANESLNQCLNVTGFDKSSSSRYKKAEELRALGNFSAAAYEFSKAAQSEAKAFDANVQIADLMKLLGNEAKSVEYYKVALDLKPNDGLLRMKYARTLDKLGNYDEALLQYNEALSNCKGDMEVLYALERIYLKKLAITPSDAELNANLGAIKQAQGDFDTALSYYNKAEQINPSNVNTRLNVGTLFQQKHDYQKALQSYNSVLMLYPDNIQANLYKAQVLSEMNNKKEALDIYKKVLSLDPTNAIAKSEITSVMQSAMSSEEYIAYLNKNISDNAIQDLLYDYAIKLHKENKTNDAIKAYKTYIEANKNNPDAYVNLAICYAAQNDYNNASLILNTAKAKFPTNALVLKTVKEVNEDKLSSSLNTASESFENKDYKKALSQYLAINPPTKGSLLGIAACYQGLNDLKNAIEYYKKAEIVAPNDSEIPYYIGYLYSEQQKWLEAEGYLRKSLKLNDNPEVKTLLSYVVQNRVAKMLEEGIDLFEKNSFDNALLKFNDVIQKDSKNAYAYYYRGLIFDEQKKIQQAISDYINVLKYSKEFPIANYMLAIDFDKIAKYKEAYNYYKQFIANYTQEDEYLQYAKNRIEELKQYAGK